MLRQSVSQKVIKSGGGDLRNIISLFKAVIEKVRFFFAVSSLRISMQPVLTIDSELAAVSLTLPILSMSYELLSLIVSSCILAASAAYA